MSNSPLVDIEMITQNKTPRTAKIDTITIHHMATIATAEACAASFLPASRKASANYCIGNDGSVALSVPEEYRSWCSSSYENDNRAITIEVSNDGRAPDWHVGDVAMEKLLALCVDICRRNGIERLNYTGDTTGNLTKHKWFQSTLCPGPYLESKFPWIAEEVNRRLGVAEVPEEIPDEVPEEKPEEIPEEEPVKKDTLYRVQVGAYSVKDNAVRMRDKLRAEGYPDAFIAEAGGDTNG